MNNLGAVPIRHSSAATGPDTPADAGTDQASTGLAGWFVARFRRARGLVALAIILATVALPPFAQAQVDSSAWPNRPLRFIVGYAAGGPADTMARLIAPLMAKELGQSIVVDNRPGASGALGVAAVMQSEPDGYTLLYAAVSEITVAPAVSKVAYDPQKDLAPIALAVRSPFILVASNHFPPNTLAELVAYAKAHPRDTSYASYGTNSINHLAGERFKQLTGIDSTHVPYKGGAQAVPDLISGRVQFEFDVPASTMKLLQAGQLKAIAVASPQRLTTLPSVPTTAEAGLPAMQVSSWQALFAPAKTPAAVIDRLNAALRKALASPEITEALATRGLSAGGGSPADLAAMVATELEAWRSVAPLVGGDKP